MNNNQTFTIGLFLLVCSACASTPHESRDLGVLTVATAGDHVLIGKANSFGFQGTFEMTSISSPQIHCEGKFRYRTRSSKGRASYTCDNDMSGTMQITLEGPLQGQGDGNSRLGLMKALFGYRLSEINEILSFPNSAELIYIDREYKLEQSK